MPARITLHTTGLEEGQQYLAGYARGVARLAGRVAITFSSRPYAWGIEHGRHRVSGRLARRAGGVAYLGGAVATVTGGADADLSAGLTRVRYPGPWILLRLARWVRRLARERVPRQSGRLRRSIRASYRP